MLHLFEMSFLKRRLKAKNTYAVYFGILFYASLLFFTPVIAEYIYVKFKLPIALTTIIVICSIPVIFLVFMGIFQSVLYHYHKPNTSPGKLFFAVQKFAYPIFRLTIASDHFPDPAESEYVYSKKLFRLYLSRFSCVYGFVLLLTSLVSYPVFVIFHSYSSFTLCRSVYSYSDFLLILWVIWALIVVAQNALHQLRIYTKDFE